MTKRNSFVLYHATAEDLIDLTDEECGKLFRALFDYAVDGKQPQLSPLCMMAFRHIRQYIDANNEKYREKCEKNSAAGKISGQVRRQAAAARRAETDSRMGADRCTAAHGGADPGCAQNEQMNENANIGESVFTDANLYEYDSVSDSVSDSESEFESVSDPVSDSDPEPDSDAVSDHGFGSVCAQDDGAVTDGGRYTADRTVPPQYDPSRAGAAARDGNKERGGDGGTSARGAPYAVPTRYQVQAYCAEQGLSTDPDRFFRINEANGWCVGGKPVRDWRALLRGWSRYDGGAPPAVPPRPADDTPVDESLLTPEQRHEKSFHEMMEKILSTPPDQLHYENI